MFAGLRRRFYIRTSWIQGVTTFARVISGYLHACVKDSSAIGPRVFNIVFDSCMYSTTKCLTDAIYDLNQTSYTVAKVPGSSSRQHPIRNPRKQSPAGCRFESLISVLLFFIVQIHKANSPTHGAKHSFFTLQY